MLSRLGLTKPGRSPEEWERPDLAAEFAGTALASDPIAVAAPSNGQPAQDPFAELAREAACGDRRSVHRLLGALAPALYTVVQAVIGRGHRDVDDATQETLIALLRALPSFRGECPVLCYASRIAFRTAVATRRRSNAIRDGIGRLSGDAARPTASALPEEEMRAGRRREILRALLCELPEAQVEALALRILLGCSMQEVADATGVPLNTVRSRLRLAKEALQRRVADDPLLAETLELTG